MARLPAPAVDSIALAREAVTSSSATSPAGSEFLDRRESDLLAQVLAVAHGDPGGKRLLEERLAEVGRMAVLLGSLPSLRRAACLGGSQRDEGTLLDHLCHLDQDAGDLALPAKVALARGFLMAKVQLLKAFRLAAPAGALELQQGLAEEIAQSVFTILAEELLRSLLYDASLSQATRRHAGRLLVDLWDAAVLTEIDDFCPVLELAWGARCWAGSALGTLVGTSEYFQLVQENCPEPFLDFFSRDLVPEEESQAFQEFLLGLPWDDVVRLRERMQREGRSAIDQAYAIRHLTVPPMQLQGQGDPEALRASFRRRQRHADFRRATAMPGPTRTAEAYLMLHLLARGG